MRGSGIPGQFGSKLLMMIGSFAPESSLVVVVLGDVRFRFLEQTSPGEAMACKGLHKELLRVHSSGRQ